MAGGHTRAAHAYDIACIRAAQFFEPTLAQLGRREETLLRIQIGSKRMIARTRNVARDRIDGLIAAGKAVGGACIDQLDLTLASFCCTCSVVSQASFCS